MKVLFIHGGNGNSGEDQTQKPMALYLAKLFETHTVKMNTSLYEVCKDQQIAAIATFKPDIVAGISLGGALLLELIRSHEWSGLSLIMCPALIPGIDPLSLDKDCTSPIILCHSTSDTVVPIAVSQQIIAANPEHPHLSLIEVSSDSHSLSSLLSENGDLSLHKILLDLWELRGNVTIIPHVENKTKESKDKKCILM